MAELNHFAIAAGMGATLGPRVPVHHGQIGSAELAATLSGLLERRKQYVESLSAHDDVSRKYEKAVIQAYGLVRQGYSSDRVLADPQINAAYIKACRDLGLDDDTFHLNLALIGLRKHNKLKAKSLRSRVPDLWRYAVASEIAARAIFYQYGASVDTLLAHPKLAREFDALAGSITPGFSSFQYRWAALNVRKKGANVKLTPKELERIGRCRRKKACTRCLSATPASSSRGPRTLIRASRAKSESRRCRSLSPVYGGPTPHIYRGGTSRCRTRRAITGSALFAQWWGAGHPFSISLAGIESRRPRQRFNDGLVAASWGCQRTSGMALLACGAFIFG